MYPEDEIETLQNDDTMDTENVSIDNNDQTKEPLVEDTQLDLEVYASNLRGTSKIQRLLYIADHCPTLRIEALKLALDYIQQATNNTVLYQEIHEKLKETFKIKEGHFMQHFINQKGSILGNSDRELNSLIEEAYNFFNIPNYDTNWVDNTTKRAALKLEKLDTDLKNYRNNFIKESIRRGHCELGEHYILCGDLANALKCFSRPRDYCTSPKHVVNMCLNVMRVSVYLQNWTHVLSYAARAESTIGPELNSAPSSGSQNNFAEIRDAKPSSRSGISGGTTSVSNTRPATTTADNMESTAQTAESGNVSSERQRPIKPAAAGSNQKGAPGPPLSSSSSSHATYYAVAASKINCLAGLAEFCRGQFGEAAARLCQVNADHITPPPPMAAAPNDLSHPLNLPQSPASVLQQQQQPLITRYLKRSNNTPNSVATMDVSDACHASSPSPPKSAGNNATNPGLANTANAIAFEDPFLLAPGNVAWYAGLAALASFDRAQLKKQVISNSSPFKLFLELEPCLRELLNAFHESKYGICLRYLEDVKDQLLLDMYAAPLVSSLYQQIQKRAMIQYVTPFTRADLNLMSAAFNFIPLEALEAQVGELIESGAIDARIDSFNKILLARDKDDRKVSFIKALKNGADFKRKMLSLILRAAAIDANIIVKPNRHTTSNNSSSGRTHSPHPSIQAQHNSGPSSSHLRE